MPATGALIGTPASMSESEPPQTEAIDDEPFDSRISETMRIVYGKSSSSGSTGDERALGERAVADLAPARAAQELRLAGAERREVVVQHELLAVLADQRVDLLLVGRRAERGDHERLRLAAREQRRAVRARQHADLAGDRADVGQAAAVDALAVARRSPRARPASSACRPARRRASSRAGIAAAERGRRLVVRLVERRVALLLVALRQRRAQLRAARAPARAPRAPRRRAGASTVALRLADRRRAAPPACRGAAAPPRARRRARRAARVSGSIARAALDHHDRVAARGDDQVQVAVGELRTGRVDDELAVDAADAHGRDRAVPRDVGDVQRGRRADDREHVGVVLVVVREHGGDDLRLAAEALREQRADRAVDQARGEDLLLGRAAFALEEAAGNLARRRTSSLT